MKFENIDRTFMGRVLFTLHQRYLVLIIGIIFITGVFTEGILWTTIFCIGVFLSMFIISFFKNIVYLKSIVLDAQENEIEITLFKFDHIISHNLYRTEDIELECYERRLVYSAYFLKVWHKNKLLIRQPAVGGWEKKTFEDITKEYKRLKSITNQSEQNS